MKKLLSLLTLLLCVCSGAWATDYAVTVTRNITNSNKTSTWSAIKINNGNTIQGNDVTATGDGIYFESKNAKITMDGGTNGNMKSGSIMYLEVPNSNSAGTITFTGGSASNTTRYVQTISETNIWCQGSGNFTASDVVEINSKNYVKLTSTSDFKFGSVAITLTSNDNYVILTKLATPQIQVTSNGEVTIGTVTNASKITYTIDGSTPTANSSEYEQPFTVDDGVVVKAIAIGDGTSYSNSDVASTTVYRTGIKIETPVVKIFNGSIAITCASVGATIKYSIDGGSTYNDYVRSFSVLEDVTLKAYATRTDCTNSDVEEVEVSVLPANIKSKTIYFAYDMFNVGNREGTNKNNLLTGKTGTDAYGYTIAITGRDDKDLSYGNDIKTPGGNKKSMKVSNGAQNTLTLPAGVKATRISFYSYNNSDNTYVYGWKEVNGVSYESGESDYKNVPLEAFIADATTTPDVRVYPLDNVEGSITYNNGGSQICYVIGLDVIIPVNSLKLQYKSGETVIEEENFDVTGLKVGDSYTVPFRMYIEKDGALYKTANNNTNPWYGDNVTLTADNTITKSLSTVDLGGGTIELFEDFDGATGDNANVRASYCSAYNNTPYTSVADLPAGTYNFIVKAYSRGRGSSVKIGEHTVFYVTDVSSSGWSDATISNVVVPEAGKLSLVEGGNNTIDWYDIIIAIRQAAPETVEMPIGSAGFATFSSLYEVAIPEGVTAYAAYSGDASSVTMKKLTDYIPAREGVVVFGDAKTYSATVTSTGATLDYTNLMKPWLVAGTPSESTYYTLGSEDGNPVFKLSTGGTLAAGKAYLVLPSGARQLTMFFDDASGITTVAADNANSKNNVFNMQGQHVVNPQKGLYIVNGKKVVMK